MGFYWRLVAALVFGYLARGLGVLIVGVLGDRPSPLSLITPFAIVTIFVVVGFQRANRTRR